MYNGVAYLNEMKILFWAIILFAMRSLLLRLIFHENKKKSEAPVTE